MKCILVNILEKIQEHFKRYSIRKTKMKYEGEEKWRKGSIKSKGKIEDKIRLIFYLVLCCCSVWLFRPAGKRVCVQSHFPLRRKLECSLWSLTANLHTCAHTLLPIAHGLACIHTHCACLYPNNQRLHACLPSWLDGSLLAQGQVWHESRLMPVFALRWFN